jgi:hypothetical protein
MGRQKGGFSYSGSHCLLERDLKKDRRKNKGVIWERVTEHKAVMLDTKERIILPEVQFQTDITRIWLMNPGE